MSKKKVDPPKARSIKLLKDTSIEFPELWMEVFVAGDDYEERAFASMFARTASTKAETPDEADLVVFTGGIDINPALYGETPHCTVTWDDERDRDDIELWEYCVEKGIPMFGVCRGAQFGAVMKGEKLYQHVDQHNGDHSMWDVRKNFQISNISSVHHQMIVRDTNSDMIVLGDCYQSNIRWRNNKEKEESRTSADIEAFFYPDVCFLGVQGHPEYWGYARYTQWVIQQLYERIVENPDVELDGGVRRIKKDKRVDLQSLKLERALA